MLIARTCIQCFSMYKKEEEKFPVFFFPFSSRVLVSESNASTRARSRERTRDWRDRRRTLMHDSIQHGDIDRMIKAPSWENVPP